MATPEEVRPKMLNSVNEYRWLRNYCEAYSQILATRAGYNGPLVEKLRAQNPKYFEDGTLKLKDEYVNKIDDIMWENRAILELGDGRRDFKRRDFNRLSRYSRELSGNNVPIAPREIAPLREQYRVASEKREQDSLNDYNTKVQEQKKAVKERRKATRGVVGRSLLFGLGLVGGLAVLGGFGAAIWTTVSGVLTTSFGITTGAGMVGVIGGVLAGKWLIGKFASVMKTLRENLSTAIKQRRAARRSVKEKKKERNAARSIYHKNALANAIDRTSEASYPYERTQTIVRELGNVHQRENGQELTDNDVLTAVRNLGLDNVNAASAPRADAPVNAAEQETGAPVNENENFVNPSNPNPELGDGSTGNGARRSSEPARTYTSNETEPEYFNENGDRFYPGPFELHSEDGHTTEPRPEPASTYTRSPFGFPPVGGSNNGAASGDDATSDLDRSTSAGTPRSTPGFVPPITPAPRPRRDEFEEERTFTYEPNRVDEHNFEEDIRSGGGSGNDAGNGTGAVTGGGSFQRNNRGNQPNVAPKTSKGLVTINDLTKYLKGGEISPEKGSTLSQYLGLGSSYSPAELKQDFEDNFTTNNIKNHTTTIKKAFNDAVKEAKEHSGSGYENSGIDLGAIRLIDAIRKEANKEPLAQTYAKSEPTKPEAPEMPDAVANDPELELTDIVRATGFEDYLLSIKDNYNPNKDDINEIKREVEEQKDKFFTTVENKVEEFNNNESNLNPITMQMVASLENEANEYVEDILNSMQNASANEITEPEIPAIDPETALNNEIREQRERLHYDTKLEAIARNRSLDKQTKIDQMRSLENDLIEGISEFYDHFNGTRKSKITEQMYQNAIDDLNVELFEMLNSENLEEIKPEEPKPEESNVDPRKELENIVAKAKNENIYFDRTYADYINSIHENDEIDGSHKNTRTKRAKSMLLDEIESMVKNYNASQLDESAKISADMYEDVVDDIETELLDLTRNVKAKNPEPNKPETPEETEPNSEDIEIKQSIYDDNNEQLRNCLEFTIGKLLEEKQEPSKENILAMAETLATGGADQGMSSANFLDRIINFDSVFDKEETDKFIEDMIKEVTKDAKQPEKIDPEKPEDNPVPEVPVKKKLVKKVKNKDNGPEPGEE